MGAARQQRGMVLLYTVVLLVLAPASAQDATNTTPEDKRNVATLARNGDLPVIRQEWKKFVHPLTWQAGNGQQSADKRFLHPVATSWHDNSVQEELDKDKRFSHPVALPWTSDNFRDAVAKRFSHPLTAALQRNIQEALDKRFSHPLTAALQQGPQRYLEDKRYVGSIARTGNLGASGKRGDESGVTYDELADALLAELVAEFFQRQQEQEIEMEEEEAENSLEKRFVASLAKSGQLPSGKRNIAAMAQHGYLTQYGRQNQDPTTENDPIAEDADAVESLIDEVAKRHLGSLAKSFNMPAGLTSGGKRNVGALARSGLLTRFSTPRGEDDKRNIASYIRGRFNGKRSPLRGNYLPFAYARLSGIRDSFVDPGKRNIQALLKSWRPVDQYNTGHGKRYPSYLRTNEIPSTRRYIAALMNSPARVLGQQNDGQKRHLGSFLATSGNRNKSIQKKSVAVVGGNENSGVRSKRQAPLIDDTILGSIEYPMPVLQGSDFYDYEEDLPAAIEEKRFLGSLVRSGWMPIRQVRSPNPDEEDSDEDESSDEDDVSVSKRHIGALARIGWLPSFRSTRLSRAVRSASLAHPEDEFHTWVEEMQRREMEGKEDHDVDPVEVLP